MGTIFSGVGLVSGIDLAGLVDNLIAVEARPRDNLLARIGKLDAQRTAYLDISARISALLGRIAALKAPSAFLSPQAAVSQPDALSVSLGDKIQPGTYDFVIKQLATAQQVVTRGFASRDTALGGGFLTLESAAARVNAATHLDELNGLTGVQRGSFLLIDAAGDEAAISTSDVETVGELVDRINGAGLNIRAEARGDGLRLTETTGGAIRIKEVDSGHVAEDLGFAPGNTYSTTGELTGSAIIRLDESTPLSALNDGLGVRTSTAGDDFRLGNGLMDFAVDLSGLLRPDTRLAQLNHGAGVELGTIRITTFENGAAQETEIDLTGLETVGQIKDAIENVAPDVLVTLTSNRLVVSLKDPETPAPEQESPDAPKLVVEDLTGRAAADLGIAGSSTSTKIGGRAVLHIDTVADVIAAIDHAPGNDGTVTASINGARLELSSSTGRVELFEGVSKALRDLGFVSDRPGVASVAGQRLLAGLDSVLLRSLNGGRGFDLGVIQIGAAGASATVDLTGAESLQEIVDRIQSVADGAGLDLEVGYDQTGTRLKINSIDGVTPVTVSDVTGALAEQTGLAGSGPVLRSDNLQRQYVGQNTRLDDLNNGGGVQLGEIRITNSLGLFADVDLAAERVETIGDVIKVINSATLASGEPVGVTARINDTGDGIVLEDAAGGDLPLTVTDQSGSAAADLRIAGQSETGALDGSFEERIELAGGETLNDLMRRINESRLATAAILNDGSATTPFRLQVSSTRSGTAGAFIIDESDLDLDLSTLTRAQDAQVVFGSDPNNGILISGSSNTFADVVPGLTLNLTATSEGPVSVTVNRDSGTVTESIDGLVSAFNAAIDRIDTLTDFNEETQEAAILLGDGTVRTIENRLFRMFTGTVASIPGGIRRLSELGIGLESGRLSFDRERFEQALADDPDAVIEFFTDPQDGFAVRVEEALKEITETGGLLQRREDSLEKQKDVLNGRVEQMNDLLDRKRDRLTRQFLAMEEALARLQSQQSALTQLAALASGGGGGISLGALGG